MKISVYYSRIIDFIVLVLLILFGGAENGKCKCRYFKPQMVQQFDSTNSRDHVIVCYDRGLYFVYINPNNLKLARDLKNQYDFGYFIGYREYYLPDQYLDDCRFCNDVESSDRPSSKSVEI